LHGKISPVLWEESREDGEASRKWSGLTDNYVRVQTRSPLDLTNTLTPARLGELANGSVLAEILPSR
jgi:hypothetical protein